MSECSSSHDADASNIAKLARGVIVATICSRASAPSPGIPYLCATWYIDSALAGAGGGVGCGCGSTLEIDAARGARALPCVVWGKCEADGETGTGTGTALVLREVDGDVGGFAIRLGGFVEGP